MRATLYENHSGTFITKVNSRISIYLEAGREKSIGISGAYYSPIAGHITIIRGLDKNKNALNPSAFSDSAIINLKIQAFFWQRAVFS